MAPLLYKGAVIVGSAGGEWALRGFVAAYDANSVAFKWYYQEVKHDVWDYDATSNPVLFDVHQNGQTIPAAGEAGKVGWMFIVDRRTGKLIRKSEPYVTGKIAWQYKAPQPLIGGALATAGNLVFMGEGNGWFDAFNAKTGQRLWRYQLGAGVQKLPSRLSLRRRGRDL